MRCAGSLCGDSKCSYGFRAGTAGGVAVAPSEVASLAVDTALSLPSPTAVCGMDVLVD